MDTLASSHTAYSRSTGSRRLTVNIFALMLFLHHSIMGVASASASAYIEGAGSVSEDSFARFRIRGEKAGAGDLLQRSGTERASQADIPARRLLGDISRPGMWPTPDGQDDVVVQEEFPRRSLVTGASSPPQLGPWFIVMHSSQDGEDSFLRQALVAEKSYPLVPLALIIKLKQQLGAVLNITSLGSRIRLSGSSRANAVVIGDSSSKIEEHGDQYLQTLSEKNSVRDSSPDPVSKETQSSTEHFEDSIASSQAKERAAPGELKFPGRSLLQGDISPPGMWPDADDDESQLSESVMLRRRRLLGRSLLQGDISPPGMWPDADDDESQLSESVLLRRRRLLSAM